MPTSTPDGSSLSRTTKVLAVVDVVESVRLMERDEQQFIRRWQRFVAFVQQRLPAETGRLHKSLGDGLMLEFSDPEGCIRAALAMRAWFAEANRDLAAEDQVQLRIGAHLAEFVSDAYDIYGTDVNLAARIATLAGPGEVVISSALRGLIGPATRAQLEDLGTCHLKHVKEPVHAFRVGQAGSAPVMQARRVAVHALRATLAVLPLELEGRAAGVLSGEALADDMVAALSRSEQLQVISRLSGAPFGAAPANGEEPRRAAGAHYTLAGRARRHGDDLSLFVELAEAGSARVVWAHSFEEPLARLARTDRELMREIVAGVHAAIITHEMERAREQPLPALEGHTLLLAAIGLMHWLSAAETQLAREMLEHLVERGRGHAAPHAWLAHLHVLALRQHGAAALAADARLASQRAAAAVQCDPGSPLALAMSAQARLYAEHDLDHAEELCIQALTARADDARALVLRAEVHALQGQGEKALATLQHAGEGFPLEPMRYLHDTTRALAMLVAGDAAGAAPIARRATERNPRYRAAWRTLIAAQVHAGHADEARRTVHRWRAREPDAGVADATASLVATPQVAAMILKGLQEAGLPA